MREKIGKKDISVLHVDDDEVIRTQLEYLIKPKVRHFFSAENGKEGLEVYLKHKPDIVITDISMPEMDGIQMAEKIRESGSDVPIIVMSSLERQKYMLDAINAGVNRFILKDKGNSAEIVHAIEATAEQLKLKKNLGLQIERNRKLNNAVDQSSSMIAVTDADGIIENVNNSFCKILGTNPAALIGKNIIDTAPEKLKRTITELLKTRQSAEVCINMNDNPTDGVDSWLSVNVSTVHNDNNEIVEFLFMAEDISESVRLEKALHKALKSAQTANKSKSVFLHNMSHELRTPLNGIIGAASLLNGGKQTTKQKEFTMMIKNSGLALLDVINNILAVSKVESGVVDLSEQKFELETVLSDVIDWFRIKAKAGNLDLNYNISAGTPKFIISDKVKIRQILMNIVGNAVKFTEKGSINILIDSELQSENASKLRMIVKDTGIGIDKKLTDKLFDRFTQADASFTRKYGGTGLGLAVSKDLSEQLKGSIRFESEIGVGTSFFIDFPVKVEKAEEIKKVVPVASAPKSQPKEIKPLDILLVEDNIINQRVMIEFLLNENHKVKLAKNGSLAVDLFSKYKFDLVFMDIEMPVMNGFDATTAIRKFENKYGLFTPIVALTAYTSDEVRDRCLAGGMNDFLNKPVNFETVTSSIERMIQKFGAKDKKINTSIDISHLIEAFGDDKDQLKELITHFMSELPLQIEELRDRVFKGDFKNIYFAAHKIKSGIGSFGARRAQTMAEEIEDYAQSNNLPKINETLNNFDNEIANIVDKMDEFLNEL